MRVLHLVNNLDPAAGGPPAIALSLAAAQASLGHEVHLVAYQGGASERLIRDTPQSERVNLHLLEQPTGIETVTGLRIVRLISDLHQIAPFDVAHLHGIWELMFTRSAQQLRRLNVPYMVILNGMLDPWSLSQKRVKKRVALSLVIRRMLENAAAIHCGNTDEVKLIEPLGLESRNFIIPNGIWPLSESQLPPRGTFRAKLPALGDSPFALFLSRLTFKKGLDLLIPAFEKTLAATPDAHLVIVGPDSTDGNAVRQLAANSTARNRIHFPGPLYGMDKFAALQDARCFVLPSRQEGFPVAVLEAVGMGVPSIITRACHFPQVEQYRAGFVIDLDVDQLAGRMVELLDSPPRNLNMARAGVRLVEQHFTWPRVAAKCIAAYEQVVGQIHTIGGAAADVLGRRLSAT